MAQNSDDQFSRTETEQRFTAALGRALVTPHKPQAKTKVAKSKAKKKKPRR